MSAKGFMTIRIPNVISGYVLRPDYVRELEPKGFPNASYSPASFSQANRSLDELANQALIAYNKACALRRKRKPAKRVDIQKLKELTEDKLIYRRMVDF